MMMVDFCRLKDAEALIIEYYEVSKIRSDAERIRQFVEIDKRLRNYVEQVIRPEETQKLRLSFMRRKEVRQHMEVHSHYRILPLRNQEKALVEFSLLLKEAMSYEEPFNDSADDSRSA